ncbi:hypothetical protein [Nocardioides sp. WS12]|uniref:hypothetical protein n=1 Tax=Nocardioides sp. WS12 TaxID=2486272 RepID=UPI0015F7931F|nr:hypothetical protein [Nocardioides sp. WS12]
MALIGSGVGLAPARSAAVDVAVVAESSDGVVLPVAYRSDPPQAASRGSSTFALSPVTTIEGTDELHRKVIRVSDGAVVRTVRVASLTTSFDLPSIVGDHLVTRATAGSGSGKTVTVDNLTSGLVHAYTIPAHEAAVTYPDWAVTTQRFNDGRRGVFLHRADGTSSAIAGPYPFCSTVNLWDSDESGVIFSLSCGDDQGRFLFDPATGSVESAPGLVLTPNRVLNLRPVPGEQEVTWAPRTDLTQTHTTTVAVDQGTTLKVLGDGLVADEPQPCDATRCGADLRAVDLATGSLGEVLLSHAVAKLSASDGSLHVTVDDGGTGELALLRAGEEPRFFTTLPAQPVEPLDVGFSGDRVVVSSREISTDPVREYAGSAWSAVDDPVTGLPLSQSTRRRGGLLVAGDSIATEKAAGLWRVVWPDGARTVESSAFTLGHRGQLVGLTRSDDGLWRTDVQDLRTGAQVWSGVTPDSSGPALDGTWVWRLADDHTLEGVDTSQPGPVRQVGLGSECFASGLQVRGRWALVNCGSQPTLFDLDGGAAPRVLLDYLDGSTSWRLGTDFAYTVSSYRVPAVRVTDFSSTHVTREIGQGVVHVVADDAGSHTLVWTDAFGRLTRTDLDWVTVPPLLTPDRTAPRLVSSSGSARYVRGVDGRRAVSVGWRYSDPVRSGEVAPSGVASYDVRWRTATPAGAWSAWSMVSRYTQTSMTRTFRDEQTACFQVRGRDRVGNLSSWSTSRCTTIDGEPPVLTRASIDTSRFDRLLFRYRATDTYGISHYVVRYRLGSNSAPWMASARWLHLTQTSVSRVRSPSRTCFKVTAVDRVGHRDTAIRCVRGR